MPDLTDRTLITEHDIRPLQFGETAQISARAIVTPLAADLARERHIRFERAPARSSPAPQGRIAVGADHGGFALKEDLKKLLTEMGLEFHDFGTSSASPVDYPDFAEAVARAVARGAYTLGIMIDGAGIGSCMAANKVRGVRAAMCYDEISARSSREHNGANVLTLGAGRITAGQMRAIVQAWISSDLTEDRHRRRVAKIDALLQ